MLRTTRNASTAATGVALLVGGLLALVGGPAVASPPAVSAASSVAAAACTDWTDRAGSGGAERYHVQCPGYYVTTWVTCTSGSPINGPKRWQYQKAECRNGARITSGGFHATRT
ncbi:hypothetical protein Xph01_08340 [Micromonospora phaseoli]|nr:hypothetical protein Xph01_08340 [Micromonospora phaseoli]